MISEQDINNATMHINGVNIADFGVLVESFKVGGTNIKNTVYQGLNRTNFNFLQSERYMRDISITLFYAADTRHELSILKATIDNMLDGRLELWLPDGFFYTSYLDKTGEEQMLGVDNNKVIMLCSYTFKGIRHDPLVTVKSNTLYCQSLIPRTDCRLSCKASTARESLTVGTVIFTGVAQNDTFVVDGIDGRILKNGSPCTSGMTFMQFPYLVPGTNTLTCAEDLTVEYYPTY